jgi:putative protease
VDYSLNVFNQQTINTYHTLGKKRVTLSYEMSKDMLSEVKPNKNQELECIVYGYAPVMILAYCPITKNPTHCESCHEPCQNHMALQDRFDEDYPLIRNGNRLEVLNSKRLNLIYKLDELVRMNIKYLRLDFTIESPEEVLEITEAYIKTLNGHRLKLEFEDETEGHYFKGVE